MLVVEITLPALVAIMEFMPEILPSVTAPETDLQHEVICDEELEPNRRKGIELLKYIAGMRSCKTKKVDWTKHHT